MKKLKKSRRERRAYNEGYEQGYLEGYEKGLHDGNPLIALAEAVKKAVNAPVIQQALKEAEEQYLNTLEIVEDGEDE